MRPEDAKRLAAQAALSYLPERGVIGLGSGSTAKLFIEEVGKLVAQGRQLQGVPTSEESRSLAQKVGIPLLSDVGPWDIDVCVDGADEVSATLDLIKGGGGCHTREKIVNQHAKTNIIVVDSSKLSLRLGEKWAVPVEVLAFGREATVQALSAIGKTTLRTRNAQPWLTDAGHYLFDVQVGPIDEPLTLDRRLRTIPGVVETGLFLNRAQLILVAGPEGVQELRPGV
jgi:ribose 5-phosphate isomerase A